MIFEKSEIKRMRHCYLKMLEEKMPSIIPENESDDYLSIGKALVLPSYVIEQSDEGNRKNIITNFLNDLYYIKQALVSSSEAIQKIFSHSLSFLLQGEDKVNFDFSQIHIEEFNHIILDDNFITLLLMEIKKRKLEGILTMLHFIEDNPLSPSKESTRFKEAVEIQIKIVGLSRRRKKVFESLAESKENKKNDMYVTRKSNYGFEALSLKETKEIDTIINDKSESVKPTAVKKAKKSSGNSEIKELDIDQLVDFITKNENGKSKKNKKKKNKKKGNSDNATETISQNKSNDEDDEKDKEIEIVKEIIKKESFNKYTIRKIQPHISQDWINSLTST